AMCTGGGGRRGAAGWHRPRPTAGLAGRATAAGGSPIRVTAPWTSSGRSRAPPRRRSASTTSRAAPWRRWRRGGSRRAGIARTGMAATPPAPLRPPAGMSCGWRGATPEPITGYCCFADARSRGPPGLLALLALVVVHHQRVGREHQAAECSRVLERAARDLGRVHDALPVELPVLAAQGVESE